MICHGVTSGIVREMKIRVLFSYMLVYRLLRSNVTLQRIVVEVSRGGCHDIYADGLIHYM